MRRQDKEIKEKEEIEAIIRKANVCRMGLCNGDVPYVVPLNFGYKDGCFFLHSAKEGKKISIIKENNNVCLEFDIQHQVIEAKTPCNWGVKYLSAICFGKAYLIENYEEKKDALDVILSHYSEDFSYEYSENEVENVAIIKVEIEGMTGKKSGY
jgi:nitroimidazol reductase NimA-like FMN-containing flavoprotein (pyridoxamine 5'-phosphate oxidase superfamily)